MEKQQLEDRIGQYLLPHVNQYIFDELSDNYLERAGIADILTGVPVPVKKTEMTSLSTFDIARNMAFIIGCDINFKYRDNYVAYIIRTFTKDFAKPLINEGIEAAQKNDFDYACICFRGSLLIDPESTDALYCYGRACKDSYEMGEGEEYVGRYKAESLEAFEKLTLKKPDFDMGYYFLGYGYLNLGLYIKAKLTWETFMELSEDEEQKKEVSEWLEKLQEPVIIEQGYNEILSGRNLEGINILSKYIDDERFNKWWPLWHFLGVAEKAMGDAELAEKYLLEALKLSPSNIEVMEELIEVYQAIGNEEKVKKYTQKVEIVKTNMEMDRAEKNSTMS